MALKKEYLKLPYRPNISLVVFKRTSSGNQFLLVQLKDWQNNWWKFPQGGIEDGENLMEAGIREFREELKYEGSVNNIKFLRSGYQNSHGKRYFVEFYTASIDLDSSFTLTKEGEVLAVQWFKPKDAITLIRSEQFTCEQAESFKQKELAHTKNGIYAVNERQFPVQNVQTLELIQSIPQLTRLYKNG